jgi:CRP-like cAMP-binding protein
VVKAYLEDNGSSVNMQEIARLRDGQSFGHIALISNKTRNATVVCLEKTNFAVIRKKDYLKIIGLIETRQLNDKNFFLWSIPVFKMLTKTSLNKHQTSFTLAKFERNNTLFTENHPIDYIYLVKEGDVQITKKVKSIWKRMAD